MMKNPRSNIFVFHFKLVFAVLAVVLFCTAAQAQNQSKVKDYVDFDLEIANNHLWRGIEVSDGLVMCADLAIHDKSNHFKVGCWSGTNTSGDYKEFNFFGEVKAGGWKLALWDTYNFSPGADYNNRDFFNYSARSTGRFLDCILTYDLANIAPSFPLAISWSTILFGRDRWEDGSANRYSCYVSADYQLYSDADWSFDAGIGGTFTLADKDGDNTTFYSDKPGLIHLQLRAERRIRITKNHTLPVFACAVFNPLMDRAFFQIGAQIFRF